MHITLYIGETEGRLDDRFQEHLCDVEKDKYDENENASKPVARHFNLPNHSKQHMAVCGLFLHQGSTESQKNPKQNFIFQIGTKRTLFIQLTYSVVFHVTMHQSIA